MVEDRDRQSASADEEHERNPFVVFRRFTDGQFAALFASFSEASKAAEEASNHIFDRLERAYDRTTSPERSSLFYDHVKALLSPPAAQQSEDQRLWSIQVSGPVVAEAQRRQEMQNNQEGSTTLLHTSGSDRIPQMILASPFDDPLDPPLEFFALSPYSPLHLEQHPQLQESRINWRHAFEDLMFASNDPSRRIPQARGFDRDDLSGREWALMLRDSARGVGLRDRVGPWVSCLLNEWYPRERFLALSELQDHTEAEMYERFLGRTTHRNAYNGDGDDYDEDNHHSKQDFWFCVHPANRALAENATTRGAQLPYNSTGEQVTQQSIPNILGTLTTTESHMLPDGSTTTRRILRRRFDDGSETTEETQTSTPPRREITIGQLRHPAMTEVPVTRIGNEDQPSGRALSNDVNETVKRNEQKVDHGSWWKFWAE